MAAAVRESSVQHGTRPASRTQRGVARPSTVQPRALTPATQFHAIHAIHAITTPHNRAPPAPAATPRSLLPERSTRASRKTSAKEVENEQQNSVTAVRVPELELARTTSTTNPQHSKDTTAKPTPKVPGAKPQPTTPDAEDEVISELHKYAMAKHSLYTITPTGLSERLPPRAITSRHVSDALGETSRRTSQNVVLLASSANSTARRLPCLHLSDVQKAYNMPNSSRTGSAISDNPSSVAAKTSIPPRPNASEILQQNKYYCPPNPTCHASHSQFFSSPKIPRYTHAPPPLSSTTYHSHQPPVSGHRGGGGRWPASGSGVSWQGHVQHGALAFAIRREKLYRERRVSPQRRLQQGLRLRGTKARCPVTAQPIRIPRRFGREMLSGTAPVPWLARPRPRLRYVQPRRKQARHQHILSLKSSSVMSLARCTKRPIHRVQLSSPLQANVPSLAERGTRKRSREEPPHPLGRALPAWRLLRTNVCRQRAVQRSETPRRVNRRRRQQALRRTARMRPMTSSRNRQCSNSQNQSMASRRGHSTPFQTNRRTVSTLSSPSCQRRILL